MRFEVAKQGKRSGTSRLPAARICRNGTCLVDFFSAVQLKHCPHTILHQKLTDSTFLRLILSSSASHDAHSGSFSRSLLTNSPFPCCSSWSAYFFSNNTLKTALGLRFWIFFLLFQFFLDIAWIFFVFHNIEPTYLLRNTTNVSTDLVLQHNTPDTSAIWDDDSFSQTDRTTARTHDYARSNATMTRITTTTPDVSDCDTERNSSDVSASSAVYAVSSPPSIVCRAFDPLTYSHELQLSDAPFLRIILSSIASNYGYSGSFSRSLLHSSLPTYPFSWSAYFFINNPSKTALGLHIWNFFIFFLFFLDIIWIFFVFHITDPTNLLRSATNALISLVITVFRSTLFLTQHNTPDTGAIWDDDALFLEDWSADHNTSVTDSAESNATPAPDHDDKTRREWLRPRTK